MKLPSFLRRHRRPIAVSVHLTSRHAYGDLEEFFVTSLVMNDGTVWRYNENAEGGWRRFYAPGDENA